MSTLIDVPAGLNGVAVAETMIGSVDGDRGFFHYREHDAAELARTARFEDVWFLFDCGRLPTDAESAKFRSGVATARVLPRDLAVIVDEVAGRPGTALGRLRAVLSLGAEPLGLLPLHDLDDGARRRQARRVAAVVPTVLARLHRRSLGLDVVDPDTGLGTAADYLRQVTGEHPSRAAVRALERYLVLTIDHGFNASTFTARVVASTGADVADVVCSAIGALAGPLHGGAPSRALDALDAIGTPDRAAAWVRGEVAVGRRIMGFGHAVYRAPDPRSSLLRDTALELGGPLIDRAVAVESEILATLADLKPGRQLPSNVEYYAGVVMQTVGLPRAMFTPTFAVSRVIGWVTHAVEQAGAAKLIRPAARYVGPVPDALAAAGC